MFGASTLIAAVILAQQEPVPVAPPPDPSNKTKAQEAIYRQVESVIKWKLIKELPKEIETQFPIRLQKAPPEFTPEERKAWVDESPNRVTFVGKFPKNLEEELDFRILKLSAAGKRRYRIDMHVGIPLREISIRLDVPPGGLIFEQVNNDLDVDVAIDFEWDFVGPEDKRLSIFNFINNRDIGLFPGGASDYVADPEKKERPKLLRDLVLQSDVDLRALRVAGIRGRVMYDEGRFIGQTGLFRIVAGAANLGLNLSRVVSEEDDLIERLVEEAINRALYENEPKLIAAANRELFVEETDAAGRKVRPFEILTDTLPKQAIPAILPGTAN